MEESKFNLVPVIDKQTGNYVIADYEKVMGAVTDYVKRANDATEVVGDELTYATARATRTDIRKHKDAITQARIHINALLLGEFNNQLKAIESLLDETDKGIKAKVDSYAASIGKNTNKPKIITLTIKGYDKKAIEKVKALAIKSGLSAEEK